jgi:hypothetical protein
MEEKLLKTITSKTIKKIKKETSLPILGRQDS